MKTALLLIACWLLALIPLDQGLTPLAVLLFHPDRELYGAAQLITGDLGTRQTQTTITITATEVLTHIQ